MINNDIEKLPEIHFLKMKDIEEKLRIFIDKQDGINESHIIFNDYLADHNLFKNKYELKSFLYLIAAISNNYHRSKNFFLKIELILKSIQEKIQQYFTNFEILSIFQRNKRLLLFLFYSKLITPTEEIYSIFINDSKCIEGKYIEYFFPEFEQYMDEEKKNSIRDQIQELKDKTLFNEFNNKREIGENDDYICYLIQNDLVIDFITYKEKNNISLLSNIKPSIYETNLFLINKNPTLIEYSTFYGSIQILRYLYQQNVSIKSSIWPFAIHGRNAEIIHFIEENKIKTNHNSFQYLIIESIKCHHNEIADYFRNNFCKYEKIYDYYLYRKALKYYNFDFLTNDMVNCLINSCMCNQQLNIPYYLSKYDYFLIVEYLLNIKTVEKILFFKRSKNILDVNYQYTIYKPVSQPNDNIADYIAIKNNDIDKEFIDEDEGKEEKPSNVDDFFLYIEKQKRKYKVYKFDVETSTILNVAIRKGNIDIIKLLLSSKQINTNIMSTIRYKKPYFLSQHCLIKEEKSALFEAIESGYSEIVQYLLYNKSFNVNCKLKKTIVFNDFCTTAKKYYDEKNEKTLLHFALEKGFIGIIKLLLSNPKIDINMKSKSEINEGGGCLSYNECSKINEKSSLFYAIENDNINVLRALLTKHKIDINFGIKEYFSDRRSHEISQDKSPLYLAVEKQNLEMVQLLLKQPNIIVNYESKSCIYQRYKPQIEQKTVLKLALEKPNTEIQLLLNKY